MQAKPALVRMMPPINAHPRWHARQCRCGCPRAWGMPAGGEEDGAETGQGKGVRPSEAASTLTIGSRRSMAVPVCPPAWSPRWAAAPTTWTNVLSAGTRGGPVAAVRRQHRCSKGCCPARRGAVEGLGGGTLVEVDTCHERWRSGAERQPRVQDRPWTDAGWDMPLALGQVGHNRASLEDTEAARPGRAMIWPQRGMAPETWITACVG
jgi:hypothetical protein